LWEAELNRQSRIGYELELNGAVGGNTFNAPTIKNAGFSSAWNSDTSNGASRNALYDAIIDRAPKVSPVLDNVTLTNNNGGNTAPSLSASTTIDDRIATTQFVKDYIKSGNYGDINSSFTVDGGALQVTSGSIIGLLGLDIRGTQATMQAGAEVQNKLVVKSGGLEVQSATNDGATIAGGQRIASGNLDVANGTLFTDTIQDTGAGVITFNAGIETSSLSQFFNGLQVDSGLDVDGGSTMSGGINLDSGNLTVGVGDLDVVSGKLLTDTITDTGAGSININTSTSVSGFSNFLNGLSVDSGLDVSGGETVTGGTTLNNAGDMSLDGGDVIVDGGEARVDLIKGLNNLAGPEIRGQTLMETIDGGVRIDGTPTLELKPPVPDDSAKIVRSDWVNSVHNTNDSFFFAYLSTNETVSNTGEFEFSPDIEVDDDGNNYDTTSGNYTIPYKGLYEFFINVRFETNGGGIFRRGIAALKTDGGKQPNNTSVNGEWRGSGQLDDAGNTRECNSAVSVIHRFNAGETVEAKYIVNLGNATSIDVVGSNDPFKTYFTGRCIKREG
jgi:hypothetical protein